MTEIKRPGPVLAKILGVAPTMFGYPFGVYSRRAEDSVAAAGYSWAFAADDKVTPVSFDDPGLDRMAVPRTITYRYNRKNVMRALKNYLAYDGPPLFETLGEAAVLPGEVAR
jgi:peptidoglycan/xylan/chitin deacetylase (PgdA/CDA1 family)